MLCAFKGTIFPPFLLWVVLCVWFFVLFVFLLFFFTLSVALSTYTKPVLATFLLFWPGRRKQGGKGGTNSCPLGFKSMQLLSRLAG